ncbi:MAG TPA: YfhO family protein [Verrucomicrobiae bacterium]|nr:YfhO family protein [Verrucomicrobiae bacterium]
MKSARGLFWYAALAGALLVLLHQSLFQGKGLVASDELLTLPPWNQKIERSNPLLSDQATVFLPAQGFAYQHAGLPLWDPDLCCGVPNLGNIQRAPLFPIRLLLSWIDPFSASGPSALLKLCLAGWFTMLYVRHLGVSHTAALLAGLVFSLSGFMIVWLGHPLVNSAMWLPALLYFVEKSFADLRAWAGFAVAFAFMILGGHPPTAIHVAIVVMIYFLFRLAEHRRENAFRRAAFFAGATAVGLLLAAPQILPYLEYYKLSSSAQSSGSMERWSMHLQISALIHFLLPNVTGNPSVGFMDLPRLLGWRETQNFNERTGYVGILPLFLALCAITLRRCRFTKFFFSVAAVSVLVICGIQPFPALMDALPVLRYANEMRLLLVVGFSVAVLAALGWDEFCRMRSERRTRIVAAAFCAAVGAAFLYFWIVTRDDFHSLDSAHWAFVRQQFFILGAGLVVTIFLTSWPKSWKAWAPAVLCVGWTAIDLLCFGTGYNPAIPRARYYPETPGIEWLQKDRSLFRIFGGRTMLAPNSAEVFGLSDTRGCDFMTVRRYEELITGNTGDFFFYTDPQGIPRAFPLLNVKYILAPTAIPLNPQVFDLVYSKEIEIYQFKECRDRALVVFDCEVEPDRAAVLARVTSANFDARQLLLLENQPEPAPAATGGANTETDVRVVSYEADDVKIDASLPRPGYLLLLDTYFPGWTATVNGRPEPIYRADYNFRAVSLPAGKSSISFSYRPESFRLGLCLCGAGILALCTMCLLPRKSGDGRKDPAGVTD